MVQDRGFLPIREKVTDSSGVISRVWGESLRGPNLRASISAEYITEWINAKNPTYGAKGDGSTDDTTSLQAAITAAANKSLYLPPGTYKYTGTLTTLSSIEMFGSGNGSILDHCSATGTGLAVNTTGKFIAKYLNFINTNATKTSDVAISLNGSGGSGVTAPIIDHCTFGQRGGNYNRIDLVIALAIQYQITFNEFLHSSNAAIYVSDTQSSDSTIMGNFINTGTAGADNGIFFGGCAGLKVIGNKILGYGYGIQVNLAAADQGPLIISGNSIENQATTSIIILTSGSGSIGGMAITGNELGQAPNGLAINTAGTSIANSQISGNAVGGTSGYAFYINGGDNICISDNHVYQGSAAFYIDTGAKTRMAILNNLIDEGVTTKYFGTYTNVVINDTINAVEFAELPTSPANGSIIYCADGTIASPVADSGSGCLAKRLDGAWVGN